MQQRFRVNPDKVYRDSQLVEQYDNRHFGGLGGRHVFQKDCAALEQLIGSRRGALLDIPCGTGIYAATWKSEGWKVIGADASWEMLSKTKERCGDIPLVLCDIKHLPFKNGSQDVITTIRLYQHLPKGQVQECVQELKRVAKPDGLLVFDTFRWSPRRSGVFKGEMNTWMDRDVSQMLDRVRLKRVRSLSLYLFSPLLYRRLPLWVLRGLDALERVLPQGWLLRAFWACSET